MFSLPVATTHANLVITLFKYGRSHVQCFKRSMLLAVGLIRSSLIISCPLVPSGCPFLGRLSIGWFSIALACIRT